MTLHFIGDAEQALAVRVGDALLRTSPSRRVPLRWSQLGAFPNARRPRVLWLGPQRADGLTESLHELMASVHDVLGPPKAAPWRPHVTLARVRDEASVTNWQQLLDETAPPIVDAAFTAVTLFESRLSSSGPAYTPRCRLPLF